MNLVEEAQSLLLHQFSHSPRLKGLIKALILPFQELLDETESLHHGRYIKDADGKRLEILGDIVGQPRRALEDEDYRAWIDVGIKLNTSAATPEDVLGILTILYHQQPHFLLHEHSPGDVVFTLFSLPKAPIKTILHIVKSSVPLTTVCHFIKADHEAPFRFDTSAFSNSNWAEFCEEEEK